MFTTNILVALFLLQTAAPQPPPTCRLNLFNTWSPIAFTATTLQTLYPPLTNPPDDRNITIAAPTTILLSCRGGRFEGNFSKTRTILATCAQTSQFEVQDEIVDLDAINCVNFAPQTVQLTDTKCGPNSKLVKIGFKIGLNIGLVPLIVNCFNMDTLSSLYTHHNITKSIGFIKSYLTTTYEMDASFYGGVTLDYDSWYNNVTFQQVQINARLGLAPDSTQIIDPETCHPGPLPTTPGFCLAMKPLTYRGDFVYILEQRATYRYINVVPQWSFLDYTWGRMERNVIDLVKSRTFDLEVFTGTYGVLTYPHAETSKPVELFLYDNNGKRAFPVPLIFWKLLYDREALSAVVLLTINDPHLTLAVPICDDISDQINWLKWDSRNATNGYSYACTYESTRRVISYLPDLTVLSTLL